VHITCEIIAILPLDARMHVSYAFVLTHVCIERFIALHAAYYQDTVAYIYALLILIWYHVPCAHWFIHAKCRQFAPLSMLLIYADSHYVYYYIYFCVCHTIDSSMHTSVIHTLIHNSLLCTLYSCESALRSHQ
jgi:hypothetical protein